MMRKRTKNKARCCGLCKPHKRGWQDRRTLQEIKADAGQEVIEHYREALERLAESDKE